MKHENIKWRCLHYTKLTKDDLYTVLHLRAEVFVVEQECPYQDLDNKDQEAFHLLGNNENGQLVAYLRIFPPDIACPEVSLGRVITHCDVRKGGIGHLLLEEALKFIEGEFAKVPVRISAQTYLEAYYNQHGFKKVGDPYLEDNIPHIEMLRS